MSPEEDRTRNAVDSEPKHYQLSYSGPGELNKSGEADTDTARPPSTDDNALDTSSTSSTSGGSRHFQEHWLKLFPWTVHEDGKMFCISC